MKHAEQNALRTLREVVRNLELTLADILIQNVNIVVVKRWYADEHFVEDDANLINVTGGRDACLV